MAANVVINVKALTGQATSELNKLKKSFADLSTSAGWKNIVTGIGVGAGVGAFNALAGAVSGAAASAGEFARQSVSAASDLAEAQNKVAVVFGDSAAAVERFASSAATSMGSSRTEALQAAGTFGNLFTTIGLTDSAAAEMSTRVLQLAGDLASFNNIATADALDKLRAGLVGEAEPLRSLGVQLTAAAVAAKAVELGLAASTSEVSESAKVQARYALILEQTTNAQGDFARTSDGLANSQRTLTAQIADLQASVGEALLPVMAELVIILRDDLLPTLQTLVSWWKQNREGIGDLVNALVPLGNITNAVRDAQQQLIEEYYNGAKAFDTNSERAGILASTLDRSATNAESLAIALNNGVVPAWVKLNRARRQTLLLKDDLYEGAEAAKTAAKTVSTTTTSTTAELAKQAKEAVASLRGVGALISTVTATMRSGWTPTVLTASQAAAKLSAAAGAVRDSLSRLKVGAESTRNAVASAFANMNAAANAYFEAEHRNRVRQIDDARRFTNEFVDRQVAGINAQVEAARAALDRSDAVAREEDLKAAIRTARTKRERSAAQRELEGFYQRQQLASLEAAADAQITALEAQRAAANEQYDQQADIEAQRYEQQRTAYNRLNDLLSDALDKAKGIWTTKNTEILALLGGFADQFGNAGAAIVSAFTSTALAAQPSKLAADIETLKKYIANLEAVKAPTADQLSKLSLYRDRLANYQARYAAGERADGGPVLPHRSYIVGERGPELLTMGSQGGFITPNGATGAPVRIALEVDGRTLAEVVDRNLFYSFRTAARTSGAI